MMFGISQVRSAGGFHPSMKEELYEAVQRLLLCLDSFNNLLWTPGVDDDPQLRLLQQEVTQNNATSTYSVHYHSQIWNPIEIFLFSF